MPVWAAMLLVEVETLRHKNVMLELRMQRMDAHVRQILRHINFPNEHLTWAWGGQGPLCNI